MDAKSRQRAMARTFIDRQPVLTAEQLPKPEGTVTIRHAPSGSQTVECPKDGGDVYITAAEMRNFLIGHPSVVAAFWYPERVATFVLGVRKASYIGRTAEYHVLRLQ